MTSQRQRVVYSVMAGITSLLLSCGFAVSYVTAQNKKWCNTLSILTENDPRQQIEPTTDAGKQARVYQIRTYDSLNNQKKQFHCDEDD